MANIGRKWKRVLAIGCTHGDFLHSRIAKDVLAFADRYKPEVRFHLGDVLDTAAFRSGAHGTRDEGADVGVDQRAGISFLERYEPTHISWGNHDARLVDLARSPNGIVAYAATTCWNELQTVANKMKAKTVPYDFRHGWFDVGGHKWGHGFWYNEQAVRDHAEYHGGPCVIAHLHRPQEVSGRTYQWSASHCVGLLADPERMEYARRRRATAAWGHGAVFGEITEGESHLWLAKCAPGEHLHFPV